jgi:hypothetical protein
MKKTKQTKKKNESWDGIFLCIGDKPLVGPFDTWKDADIAEVMYTSQPHVWPIRQFVNVRRYRRGVWMVQPRSQ